MHSGHYESAAAPMMAAVPSIRIGDAGTGGGSRFRNGLTAMSRGFVLEPPPPLRSWGEAPPNPCLGLGGLQLDDLTKEDFRFYCDPCQKGFNSKRMFDQHMEDHIYCEVPGCKFTCRKGKEWKMELHISSLHNRPDAPDLENTEQYLLHRRKRFPTVSTVKTKVEELYYRAARGEVLPDERRRWLKQHGVYVSSKWFVPVMREGDEALERSRRRRAEKRQRQLQQPQQPPQTAAPVEAPPGAAAVAVESPNDADRDGHDDGDRGKGGGPRAERGSSVAASAAGGGGGEAPASDVDGLARYQRRPGERMLPLGPNGRFTKSQLVTLVRERYDATTKVPAFYVCNRCGEKGHWVEACPKAADRVYDAEARWAVAHPNHPRPQQQEPGEAQPTPTAKPASTARADEVRSAAETGGDSAARTTSAEMAALSAEDAPPESSARAGGDEAGDAERLTTSDGPNAPPQVAGGHSGVGRHGPSEARIAAVKDRSARRAATAALEEGNHHPAAAAILGARLPAQRRFRHPPPPRPPTLWERLTEDQRMNEHSVLLQAIRFFVVNNFLTVDDDAAGGAEGVGAAPAASADAGGAPGSDAPPGLDAKGTGAPKRRFGFKPVDSSA